MKNKGIVIFLIILALVIVAVFVGEYMSDKPNKSEANPYEYNIDEFKDVNDDLVIYKETKNLKIGFEEPDAIAVGDGEIYVAGDATMKIVNFSGTLLKEFRLPGKPHSLEIKGDSIFVALEKQVMVFSNSGDELLKIDLPGENTYVTSVAVFGDNLFVADAGNRKIFRFNKSGEKINEFEGKAGDDVLHGFIIPSPYFDIDINSEGELWVVNPGMHSFENYEFDGDLRAFWENTSMKIDGFSGCCNPAHFTFLPGGNFVTSEKGLVRIKVHKPSGELLGVVAPPVKFDNEDEAPDIATDTLGNVYALDFKRKMIRVFELK